MDRFISTHTHSKDLNENTSKSWRSLGTQKALEGHQRAPKDTWTFPHSCHLPLGQWPINYSKEGNKNTGNSWSFFWVKANEKTKILKTFLVISFLTLLMVTEIFSRFPNILVCTWDLFSALFTRTFIEKGIIIWHLAENTNDKMKEAHSESKEKANTLSEMARRSSTWNTAKDKSKTALFLTHRSTIVHVQRMEEKHFTHRKNMSSSDFSFSLFFFRLILLGQSQDIRHLFRAPLGLGSIYYLYLFLCSKKDTNTECKVTERLIFWQQVQSMQYFPP